MKKILSLSCLAIAVLSSCGSHKDEPSSTVGNPAFNMNFEYTVTQDNSFGRLPSLQSFILSDYNNQWLMFSGRTNGFHGFNPPCDTCGSDFPLLRANDSAFVYDRTSNTLYSMVIPHFGNDLDMVFRSTNLAHTEKGKYLYACGGYGVRNLNDTFARKTYNYFMRIDMDKMIGAIKTKNSADFISSVEYGQSDLVCSTGGELYLLPDNNFYIVVGHKFTGRYLDSTAQQNYVDKVNVFSLAGSGNQLMLTKVDSITDGLPDSTTQFRRRDLVVAPAIQSNGTDIGISVYGGVFHYMNIPFPSENQGPPFINPIYINPNASPKFKIDSSQQYSNIYAAPFFCMYESGGKTMTTTLFGGLGDTKANIDSANWTTIISTAKRNYANGGDTTFFTQNQSQLPAFMGSEADFIPASDLPLYANNGYKIFDYDSIQSGQTVGYIFGGIHAINRAGASTWCSNQIYKVVLNKITIVADEKK